MSTNPDRQVVALMGPTASGKTDLAIKLADQFNLSLISVDSAMVYRGMDIGTAKPALSVRQSYPHALIDIVEPENEYSVADFVKHADAAVDNALRQGKLPFLVGGTMMYFKAFREGIATLPGRDAELRRNLRQEVVKYGLDQLHKRLEAIDPVSAGRIHPNNYSRIERALEVHVLSGKPMSQMLREQGSTSVTSRLNCRYTEIALVGKPRVELHQAIEERVHQMLASGFVDEVASLMQRKELTKSAMSMKCVGYRQLWEFLELHPKETVDKETTDSIVAATRQLARRQCTWLRQFENHSKYFHALYREPMANIVSLLTDVSRTIAYGL